MVSSKKETRKVLSTCASLTPWFPTVNNVKKNTNMKQSKLT